MSEDSNQQSLADSVALITGGARGQGAAEARACVAEGATVVVTDVDDDLGEALAAEIGATYHHLDVADDDAWAAVVDETVGRHGQVDGLVNNAGIFVAQSIADGDLETTRRIWEVNQLGTWVGMRRVVPSMTAAGGGSIVNISSIAAMGGYPAAAYGTSKWAVRGMTKSAAKVLGVVLLNPYFSSITTPKKNNASMLNAM